MSLVKKRSIVIDLVSDDDEVDNSKELDTKKSAPSSPTKSSPMDINNSPTTNSRNEHKCLWTSCDNMADESEQICHNCRRNGPPIKDEELKGNEEEILLEKEENLFSDRDEDITRNNSPNVQQQDVPATMVVNESPQRPPIARGGRFEKSSITSSQITGELSKHFEQFQTSLSTIQSDTRILQQRNRPPTSDEINVLVGRLELSTALLRAISVEIIYLNNQK